MKNNKLLYTIIFGGLTFYGVWNYLYSQTHLLLLSLGIACLWLILYSYLTRKIPITKNLNVKEPVVLLSLLVSLAFLGWNNLTIEHPLKGLTFTDTYTIVPSASEGNVDISQIQLNNEALDLNILAEQNGWTYKESLSTSSNHPLTIDYITNETLDISFLKTATSKEVSIYRNDKLIQTLNLLNDTEYEVKIKVSRDHLLLLIPAYLGVIFATHQVVHGLLILINKKFKIACPPALHDTKTLLYLSLPLEFIALFKWAGLAHMMIRPWLIGSVFVLLLGLELYFFKSCTSSYRSWCRVTFYLLFTAVLSVIGMQIIYFFPNLDVTMTWIAHHINIILLTATIILSISRLLFSIFNHLFLAISLSSIFMFIVAVANYYKMLVVGEPIYPADLSMLENIGEIIGFVKNILSPVLLIGLFIVILILAILSFIFRHGTKLSAKLRAILFAIFTAYIVSIFYYDKSPLKPLVSHTVYFTKWNQLNNYQQNGFLFGFITNLQNDLMIKNEAYTKENMNEIVDYYTQKAKNYNETLSDTKTPNFITIVSESLSDPTVFDQLSFSEDPLPNLRTYLETYSSGKFLSPFKGNRTANVEFEYLMGFTNSLLLEGTIPFQQSLSSKSSAPSFISFVKQFGYQAVAVHPNNAAFYKRSHVYPAIGFDKFISINEMTYREYIDSQKYISDKSVLDELYQALEKADTPIFAYGLTMANHIAIFDQKFGENTIDVIDITGAHDTEMETYAEGLKQSDAALKEFITKIENYDEPTIVIFFGDHLINFQSDVHEQHGFIEKDTNALRAKLFFETPLLIMSNMDDFAIENINDISPIFIAPLILKELQMPLSPFYMLLLDLYEEFSVLHNNFKMNASGDQVKELSPHQEELLLALELIQYDILEGKEYTQSTFFNSVK